MKTFVSSLLILLLMPAFAGAEPFPKKKMKADGSVRPLTVCMLPASFAADSHEVLMKTVDTITVNSVLSPKVYVIPEPGDSLKPSVIIYKNFVIGTSNWKYLIQELYPNGNPAKSFAYDKNGKAQPMAMEMYENLSLKVSRHYMNGKPIRRWKYFDEKGYKTKVEIYRHGLLVRTKVPEHLHKSWMTIWAYHNSKGVNWKIS